MKFPASILILTPLSLCIAAIALAAPSGPAASTQSLRKWSRPSMNSVHAAEVSVAFNAHQQQTAWVRFAPMSPASILAMQAAAAPEPLQLNPLPVTDAEVSLDVLGDSLPAQVYRASAAPGQSQAVVAVPAPAGGWLGQPMKVVRRAYSSGALVYEDEAVLIFR